MSAIVKKKRKFKMFRISLTLFIVMGIVYIASSTLLRSYNVSLIATKDRIDREIRTLSKEKETLQLDITELSSYSRIMAIVEAEGLTNNQANIVVIPDESINEKD